VSAGAAGGNGAPRSIFNRPGKPTDNAFLESSNERLRDECLKVLVAGRRDEQDRPVVAAAR
jgi:transposase InsO family protein